MGHFKDKRILITGASAGIGLEMAKILSAEKAQLALLARDMDKLRAFQDFLAANFGLKPHIISCDVRNAELVRSAVAEAVSALGGLDGVIANSGLCLPGRFHEMDIKDVDTQIDTNLKGVYYTCHAAMPYLLKSVSPFVAITSSPAGVLPIVGFSAYAITKAGLNILSETLRFEYEKSGLRVHLLLPPDTDTPGYQHEITLYPPETRAVLSGGKLLNAEEVAHAFVLGMKQGKPEICPTWDAKLMMNLHRMNKQVWTYYTKWQLRKIS